MKLKNEQIPQVNKFKYRGCCIINGLKRDLEIQSRIEIARSTLKRIEEQLLKSNTSATYDEMLGLFHAALWC